MQSWNLKTPPENAKGRRELFSTRETRMDLVDLGRSTELVDPGHGAQVVIQVLSGRVNVLSPEETASYDDGTLLAIEPGEAASVRALEQSRLLLTFSPRRASHGHSPGSA